LYSSPPVRIEGGGKNQRQKEKEIGSRNLFSTKSASAYVIKRRTMGLRGGGKGKRATPLVMGGTGLS